MTMKPCSLGLAMCCILTVLISGCATMGPAPAKLSAEVGDRIAEMQGLHLHAIKSFFDSERGRVEDFLEKRWIPLYLQNFLATSRLMEEIERSKFVGVTSKEILVATLEQYLDDRSEASRAIDEIVDGLSGLRRQESSRVRAVLTNYVEDEQLELAVYHISSLVGAPDPGLIILEWAQDAQEEINLQRESLLEPLEEAERAITSEIIAAYADIMKANGVVTARLEAAAKLRESQDKMLDKFGVRDEVDQLRSKLANISYTIGEGLAKADSAISNLGKGMVPDSDSIIKVLSTLKMELRRVGSD